MRDRSMLVLLLVGLTACPSSPEVVPDDAATPRDDVAAALTDAPAASIEDAATITPDGGAPAPDAPSAPDAAVSCTSSLAPGDHTRTIEHDGETFRYHVHVPASASSAASAPVVLFFHGGGGTADGAEMTAQLTPTSDAHGFVLVRPEGYAGPGAMGQVWNAGACCGQAVSAAIDHVGAVRALLDDLATVVCVDPDRVFATGHSNGGMMSYRLACELADRIAAIAPNAAFLTDQDLDASPPGVAFPCAPSRPVPVLHMHGLADMCAPYEGGESGLDPALRPPVSHGIDTFRTANGCTSAPAVTYERGAARCTEYGGCSEGADVVLCTIDDAGHVWPGSPRYPMTTARLCGGTSTDDLDANELLWEFFAAHPRRPS